MVLLKHFGATPVHVWCCASAAQTLWSYACACLVLRRTSKHEQKYEITLCQRDLKCGEAGFRTCSGQPRASPAGNQKNTHLGTVQPGLIPSVGFIYRSLYELSFQYGSSGALRATAECHCASARDFELWNVHGALPDGPKS